MALELALLLAQGILTFCVRQRSEKSFLIAGWSFESRHNAIDTENCFCGMRSIAAGFFISASIPLPTDFCTYVDVKLALINTIVCYLLGCDCGRLPVSPHCPLSTAGCIACFDVMFVLIVQGSNMLNLLRPVRS